MITRRKQKVRDFEERSFPGRLSSPAPAIDTQFATVTRDDRVFPAWLNHRNHPALNRRSNSCKSVMRMTEANSKKNIHTCRFIKKPLWALKPVSTSALVRMSARCFLERARPKSSSTLPTLSPCRAKWVNCQSDSLIVVCKHYEALLWKGRNDEKTAQTLQTNKHSLTPSPVAM